MKKTMHDIFDEADAAKIDNLVKQNDVPEASPEILSSVKKKVYAKTGLKSAQKKNSVEVIGRYVAVAACLCMMIGVVLFAVSIFNFDGVSPNFNGESPNENTEQDKDFGQGDGSEENDGGQQGGPSDGNVETVTKGMNISQNSSLFPLFEKNCFYAYDDENNFYRILWSDFTGLSEKDRIIVEYRDLKKIVYSEYDVIYEVTAVRVERVSDEFYSPFKLTCKFKDGCTDTIRGYESELIVDVLKNAQWSSDLPNLSPEYIMTFGALDIYYHSESGIFWDLKNDRHFRVSDAKREAINGELPNEVYHSSNNEHLKIQLEVDQTCNVQELILFSTGQEYCCESLDPSVAAVNENTVIIGKGAGKAVIQIYVVHANQKYLYSICEVTVNEPWNPTDPISGEVLAAKKTLDCYQTFDWFMVNISGLPHYNIREDENTTAGPVEIWGSTLLMDFRFQQAEINATIGYDDMETYNFYFDFYYRPYDEANDRTDYKKATLQPWSIYTDKNAIYRCKFYDQFFVENDGLVEDQKYEVVIVVREGDKQLGYAESELTWADSCAIFTEYAEMYPEIIK